MATRGRGPLPPVDPRAAQRAFRVLTRKYGDETTIRRRLFVAPKQWQRITSGEEPVKLARLIVERMLEFLDGAVNAERVKRVHALPRETMGSDAFERAVSGHKAVLSLGAEPGARPHRPPVAQRPMLGGLHVAPFLSRDGNVLLAAIDGEGALGALVECGRPTGGKDGSCGNNFSGREAIELTNEADVVWDVLTGVPNCTTGNPAPKYGFKPLGRSVHHAPWRPWDMSEGHHLMAIDHQHRLVASMEAVNPPAARDARRKLMTLLGLLAPEPYHDPYDDGECDDDVGDSWNRDLPK